MMSGFRGRISLTGPSGCRHDVFVSDGAEDLRLWDAAALAYAGREDSFYRRIHGFLWDRLGDVRGLEILDLGCGDGWLGHRHYHRPLSWYIERLVAHGLVVTGLHEPPSLPREDIPEADWTEYQRWFSSIPTLLAVSCTPGSR